MTVQVAIEVRAVGSCNRAGQVTVRDVSLSIGHGELVAIIGGRGSGKTTLLDVLSGLRLPSTGTVLRHPQPHSPAATTPVAAGQIGYVPNAEMMHPILPLGRALRFNAALHGARVDDGAAEEALKAVDLTVGILVPVGELNPGERKRAAIAAELLFQPAQLFLEEPTADLDPAQAAEVLRLLRRVSEAGTTVVLTTSSPLDAARCDKVAVLAAGGHLAFFGTPAAARGYFGADSLEEIYERLVGLGDPATAWSRRFFHFSRPRPGLNPPTTPRAPGPRVLVPDLAGPHSAGRPGPLGEGASMDVVPAAGNGQADAVDANALGVREGEECAPKGPAPGEVRGFIQPVRQLPVLIKRNAETLIRSRLGRAVLTAAPAAVLIGLALLIGAGALDGAAAGRAWVVFGGVGMGLAYGLPQVRDELGVLRAERFAGLSAWAYVLAKAAVLVPPLAVADAIALLIPMACSRLAAGYGPSCVTLVLSSAAALALALLLSAGLPGSASRTSMPAALCLSALLLTGAILALLDRPTWPDWVVLAALAVSLTAAAIALIARRFPTASFGR